MTLERSRQRLDTWRRLNELRRIRTSLVILDAAKDWLDKEIEDLELLLKIGQATFRKKNIKMTTFWGRGHSIAKINIQQQSNIPFFRGQ
jgi:ribosomal protein L30E